MGIYSVDKLITQTRRLAREYREATGRTLPVTAEIAINDAIRILDMTPAKQGTTGYDAILHWANEDLRVQIKGRVIFNERHSGYRIGQLKMDQIWDAVLLVLMDNNFETDEIYIAKRDVLTELTGTSSKNKKGPVSVAKFRAIGQLLWSQANGKEDDGYWTNAG